MPAILMFSLCLALFAGACWARGTTVGVGETVPLGGTTTTTTTTTNTTTTTHEGSSEPTPQVTITPADGGTAPSTEGSGWENLGVMGGSGNGSSGSGDTSGAGEGATSGSTAAPSAQQNTSGQGTSPGCAPALVLAGIALSLFVFRN